MSGRSRWRLAKSLTIYQAALLIEGYDPAKFEDSSPYNWHPDIKNKTAAVIHALRSASEDGTIKLAKEFRTGEFEEYLDLDRSLMRVDDIRSWLEAAGFKDGFFVPIEEEDDGPGDFFSPYYAPKLAAANDAWKAVTSDKKWLRGRSPKKAIELWLKENAARYGLLNKDGTPNATGIEEIAKVANWKPAGGAPTTPKDRREHGGGFGTTVPPLSTSEGAGSFSSDLDDDIPF
ncbi:hypothetical protein [Xanthobacter aminoxidans]|uniref:hypothetical protein n=1 Tax=Xanthobacter aminoxidans TaxID=186280 RepID=UPI002022EB12|nr:hypothetical protein [Xanthobacter aminoxidans]MCL8380647.1 hypothetical protein [Xanthobacter aminoxidans]